MKEIENKEKPRLTQKPTEPKVPPQNGSRRKSLLIWVTVGLLILGIAFILYWLLYLQYHESTDDAYANGNMVNINAAVQGSVIAFYADDTDLVKQGQLLVELDATPYQVNYERELATLASTVLQVRQLYDNVLSSKAVVENRKIAVSRAQFDFDNRSNLIDSLAVSNEDYIHAQDTLKTAELDLKQAEYQFRMALDAAGNTEIERHPLIEAQKAAVRTAFYNLHHCRIYAPTTGFVAQRTVEVGQSVVRTTNLMAVIPKDYMWVDANFKETQLRYMRIGQPARLSFDLYGSGAKFSGKVIGIASGSGSVFSIIPPQNATGNWIKIVQRLPVRISLDPEEMSKFPPRLGISAEVVVDTSDDTLPILAQTPAKRAVDTTSVFNLDFTTVDQLIEKIILENLRKKPC